LFQVLLDHERRAESQFNTVDWNGLTTERALKSHGKRFMMMVDGSQASECGRYQFFVSLKGLSGLWWFKMV